MHLPHHDEGRRIVQIRRNRPIGVGREAIRPQTRQREKHTGDGKGEREENHQRQRPDERATHRGGVALEKARRLAAKPRAALAASRRMIRGDGETIMARIDEEALAFEAALRSDEARAAFMAFMSKGKA